MPVHRLWAVVFAGLIVVAGTVGMANAAEKKSKRTASADNLSAGIQDPMNPEAYMRDLAARMDSGSDRDLLLKGTGTAKAGPAPTARTTRTVVAGANRPTSGTAGKVTTPPVPAMSSSNEAGAPNTTSRVQEPKLSADPIVPAPPSQPIQNPASMPPAAQTPALAPASMENAAPTATVSKPPMPDLSPAPAGNAVSAATVSKPPIPDLSSTPAGREATAVSVTKPPVPTLSAAPVANELSTIDPSMHLAPAIGTGPLGNGSSSARLSQSGAERLVAQGTGPLERDLIASKPGLTLWNEPQVLATLAAQNAEGGAQAKPPAPEPEGPWTLGGDLEKYRAHAVKDGSRSTGESLKKALERTGMTLGDSANVFVLGYGSDRAKPFRQNDGKGIFQEPGKVPARAGATIGSLGYALYSIVDLATLNALPDPNRPVYKDNNPLVRPLVFTGRAIGGVWKTTEEVGNALTWGLFDNVTGCVGLVIEDIVELVKHAGEAVTNVVRAPFHLAAGKKKHEGADQALDWVLLVPLELASNAVEMKGFSNMEDYKTAFADKGVIGSVLEFGGSTYLVYRAVDKLTEKQHKKHKSDQNQTDNQNQNQNPGDQTGGQNPPAPPDITPVEPPEPPADSWVFISSDWQVTQ